MISFNILGQLYILCLVVFILFLSQAMMVFWSGYHNHQKREILHAEHMWNLPIFACEIARHRESKQFCMAIVREFAWVWYVKMPVKYLLYSSKFRRGCWQFACVLREVLATWMQVNVPILQVNCLRGLLTSGAWIRLPVLARATFSV